MPVVGDPETMNDTYVEQIAQAAEAAIDVLDAKGVVDRRRVVVGGHSYGAFMTANLLAHTDLFAAGIARSGAYNRTLTPFGFQSERRSFWEAPELYLRVSPFTYAHKINEPILLIHGEADNNSGTFPIQSERLYQALRGNGGTARYVVLPERGPRVPRARVGARHAGRDDRVGGPLGEEPPGGGRSRHLCPEGAQKRSRVTPPQAKLLRLRVAAVPGGVSRAPGRTSPPKRSSLQLHCEASPAGARAGPSPARPERGVANAMPPLDERPPAVFGELGPGLPAPVAGQKTAVRSRDGGRLSGGGPPSSGPRTAQVAGQRRPGVHAPSGTRRSPGSAAFALSSSRAASSR